MALKQSEMQHAETPKKDVKGDFEVREQQLMKASTSRERNPYSQAPDDDGDDNDFEVVQKQYLGDNRIGRGGLSESMRSISQAQLASTDSNLWPEQYNGMPDPEYRDNENHEASEGDSSSINDEPVSKEEAMAVLNCLMKGFKLRTKRAQEIASQFSDEEVSQIRDKIHSNRLVEGMDPEMFNVSQIRDEIHLNDKNT